MDKQIEELTNDLSNAWYSDIIIGDKYKDVAEKLTRLGYCKIPEGAVVLTEDNAEEIGNMVVKSPQMQEAMLHLIKAWQKETAEKFAERVKMAFYYEFDELIPSIMADKIDEIAKEITEGEV